MERQSHHSYATLVNEAKNRANFERSRSLIFSLPWFQKGDWDAFTAVTSNNMATMLVCLQLLLSAGFSNEIVYGKISPGIGISMAFGSVFYMFQALIVARHTGRQDICAQPFGINTPGAFAFISSIILPVYFKKLEYDQAGNPTNVDEAATFAWKVGVAANFVQGVVEVAFAVVGPQIQSGVPLVALLTSLASIGFAFLLSGPMLSEAAKPALSWICIFIVFLGYFAGVKWMGVPTSVLVMIIGSAIGWAGGYLTVDHLKDEVTNVKMYSGDFAIVEIFENFHEVSPYIGLIIPVGLTVAVGTIQCVELAKTAGDTYNVRWSMLGDGLATIVAACFGSVFGMTVFIGHPAFKAMGARVAYNALTAAVFIVVCFTGLSAMVLGIVAIEALNPILLFVGIIVCVDTLHITPKRHYAAFILGLLPAVCNWAGEKAEALVRAAAPEVAQTLDFQDPTAWRLWGADLHGLYLLGSNYLVSSIVLCCMMLFTVDRNFPLAAFWALVGAICSLFGFMHSIELGAWVKPHDYGWRFCVGYTSVAALFGLLYVGQRYGFVEPPFEDEGEKTVAKEVKEEESDSKNPLFCIVDTETENLK
mmetsp:Transcript_18133/g.28886  ORF Transcript_18133/g.28886 Transcript_18133/m.28886 type:complete len:590 (-) Transcript_18133:191-1960(-)